MRATNRVVGGNRYASVLILAVSLAAAPIYAGTVVPDPVLPDPSGINKNRYLSIELPPTGGPQEAILVTIVHAPEFPDFDGLQLWAGPPSLAPDENSANPNLTITVSRLQCQPYFGDWTTTGLLNIYGGDVVSGSVYAIQRVDISCPDLSDPACYSAAITVGSAKFGDVDEPFEGPGVARQPDVLDLSAGVLKFLASPESPTKTQVQLIPQTPFPDRSIDLNGLYTLGTAIRGMPYSALSFGTGPCACPSPVVCGATSCTSDSQCGSGLLCIDGGCMDACGRCSPAGSICGDGIIGADEQCDDGGTTPGDGCNQYCQFEYTCGNGVVEPGESCDDGNAVPGDGCDQYCQLEGLCGNGVQDSGEFCDDGNTTNGDGCDSTCRIEPACGNGIVEHLEECDDGNLVNGDGCSVACMREDRSVVLELVPVAPTNGSAYPANVIIDGSEILLPAGGQRVWLEFRMFGWDPALTGHIDLVAWQATLDSSGLDNGSPVPLEVPRPGCSHINSTGDPVCEDAFGPGSACNSPGLCTAAFMDQARLADPQELAVEDASADDLRWGGSNELFPGGQDDGTPVYAGNIALDVPVGATGSYVIDVDHRVDATFLIVRNNNGPRERAPVVSYQPAVITVAGGCCIGSSCSALDLQACVDAGGTPVAACGGDCNGNGHNDACDIAAGTSADCNYNGIPDECEPDCNNNGRADDCDIANYASTDCNDNGIPDECEPNEDCNNNFVQDICDIAAGTSEDCNGNLVPDECEPGSTEDCNNNGVPDLCDLFNGTAFDCNENGMPDSCDIANGTSLDDNLDGLPDECCVPPAAPLAELQPIAKNRYLTMRPDPSWAGRQIALRVNPLTLPGLEYAEYVPLWVGPLGDYPDENAAHPGQTFRVARLQCDPYYHDWSGESEFHVIGAEIIPSGRYKVQAVEAGCNLSFASSYSEPLAFTNAKFGDVFAPYDGEGSAQPDFTDIAAEVDKFLAASISPPKARAQLQPSVIRPSRPIDFNDISAAVNAFLGTSYVDGVSGYSGVPQGCTCPSAVTCGATACISDGYCSGGVCLDGFCTDACGRCTP